MAKKILFGLLFLIVAQVTVNAQFNRKRLPYSDADLKKLFAKAIKEDAFDDDIFETKDVPEQWKNESIVMLGRKIRYEGNVNPWNNIGYLHYFFRMRLKLQDQVAVEGFSEYYFDDNDMVEITIIKPDGKRNKVDLDDAIEVKENINGALFYGSIAISSYKKLAIPNLEPGDIIDIISMDAMRFNRNYFHWTDPITVFVWPLTIFKLGFSLMSDLGYTGSFDGKRILYDEYPIVDQRIEFDLGRNYYLNFRSLNGAPDLDEETSKSRSRRLWVFRDHMREKIKDERFSEPMASLAAIKYEITFANNREKKRTDRLIDRKNKLKTTVNEKDIKKIAWKYIRESRLVTGNIYYDYYKEKGGKINDDQEFIETFYNHYRTTKLYQVARNSDKAPYNASINNADFVQYMIKIVRKRMLKYTLIMGVPRAAGGMDGLISAEDAIWGIKVLFKGGTEVIYTDCDLYAQPGEINPAFEGIKMYEIFPAGTKRGLRIDEYDVPVTRPSQNQFSYQIKAEFQPDLDTMKVYRKTHLTGMPRYRYKAETFSYSLYFEKVKEEFKLERNFVIPAVYEEDLERDDDFLDKEEERITETRISSIEKNVREGNKRDIQNDYIVVSYDKMKVLQTGLELGSPDIIFEEDFRLRDMLDNIGDNTFILKAGEFIDGQIEIKDKEDRERQGDIVYPYSRSFLYEIEIIIPGGMKVEGMEQLNRSVDNSTGSFNSTATLDGSTLKIRVEKVYKDNFHPKDKWEDLLKFVDEAADFRSVKLILKR